MLATAQPERKERGNSERAQNKQAIVYRREAPGHLIQCVRPLGCCRNDGSTGCRTAPSAFRRTPNQRKVQHTCVHGNGRTSRQHSTAVAGSGCYPAENEAFRHAAVYVDVRNRPSGRTGVGFQFGPHIGGRRRSAHGRGKLNAHTCTRTNPQASETANAEAKQSNIKLLLAMACMGSLGINVEQFSFEPAAGISAINLWARASTSMRATRIARGHPRQGFVTFCKHVGLGGNTCRGVNDDDHDRHERGVSRLRRGKLTGSEGRHWILTWFPMCSCRRKQGGAHCHSTLPRSESGLPGVLAQGCCG